MSVTLVNGHVLLPHLPNWAAPIAWQRIWQTQVDQALTGSEARRNVRPRPRLSLRWELLPFDAAEQALMFARLTAARASGYACVPYWGRGLKLAAQNGAAITLAGDAWAFLQADDWVLVRGLDGTQPEAWEVAQATVISGTGITLATELTLVWGSEAFLWPLLFGTFHCGEILHRSDWHGRVGCEVRTLVTKPLPIIDRCAYTFTTAPAGASDTFECYPVGPAGTLAAGSGWTAALEILTNPFGITAYEPFNYTSTLAMNGGFGWVAQRLLLTGPWWRADEGFETYLTGSLSLPLDGGSGWAAPLTLIEL